MVWYMNIDKKIWEKILVPTFIKLIREYSQIPFLAHLLCNQQQEKNIHLVLNINNRKKSYCLQVQSTFIHTIKVNFLLNRLPFLQA